MRFSSPLVLTAIALFSTPAAAETIDVSIAIPRLSVAEYHRPYVAIWLERPGSHTIRTFALWYDHDMRNEEGRQWLSDLRSWWRKGGRSANLDSISGATRAPGPQNLSIPASRLRGLPAGEYRLVVEAAREVGGRELVQIPITLGSGGRPAARAEGNHELGVVTATVRP